VLAPDRRCHCHRGAGVVSPGWPGGLGPAGPQGGHRDGPEGAQQGPRCAAVGLGAKGEGRGPGACAPGLQRNMTAAAGKAISPLQPQDPPPLPPRSRGCMLPPLLLLVCGTTCPDSSCRLRGRLSAESFCTTLLVYTKTLSSQLCPPWLGSAVTLSAKVVHGFVIEFFCLTFLGDS
jgi:hypothetical protein